MNGGRRARLALVVQRYGAEIGAGSEDLCRLVAERLARRHHVEVLTTCALDYRTWANHYPPGESELNGVRLRRFPVVAERDPAAFAAATERLFAGPPEPGSEEAWIAQQGPDAPELLAAIAREADAFDAFVFFTYLYATSVRGLPLVRDKAVLVPTAHEEAPIHLGVYRELFALPRHLIFLTPTERRLVHGLFGNEQIPWTVAGVGIDPPRLGTSRFEFRRRHGLWHDILLYLGRVDEAKNVDTLLHHFDWYRRRSAWPVDLVLVGRLAMDVPPTPGVAPLGFLGDAEKNAALAAATVFAMPSRFESFSIATMEAWQHGVPALVDAHNEVMVDHCHNSRGGLYYRDHAEFAAQLHALLSDARLRRRLGANGRRYVEANYRWERIEPLFERAILSVAGSRLDQSTVSS